jgi:hypothetical protein
MPAINARLVPRALSGSPSLRIAHLGFLSSHRLLQLATLLPTHRWLGILHLKSLGIVHIRHDIYSRSLSDLPTFLQCGDRHVLSEYVIPSLVPSPRLRHRKWCPHTEPLFSVLLPLANYPAALNYCSSKYPVKKTMTTTETSKSISTTVFDGM